MYRYLSLVLIMVSIVSFVIGCSDNQQLPSSGTTSLCTPTPTLLQPSTPPATPLLTPTPAITPAPTSSKKTFSKADFSRIDGSTATIPLSEAIAAALLNISPVEASQLIQHNKTHQAYVRLVDKEVDFILVTEPSEEELKIAKEKGIELEVIPVVKDAFVFLLNIKNPVQSLTQKQIQDIYSGKISNWKEVGGVNGEVLAYQRPVNSGSQTLMENLVMKGLKLKPAPKELMPSAMGELIERVAGYKDSEYAIGYSVYYYANTMYNQDTVKLIGVDGIKPDKSSIQTGKYPYTSAYYAVLRKSDTNDSLSRRMLQWVLSPEGQNIAEKSGYIPVK